MDGDFAVLVGISIHAPHAGRDSRSDSHSGQQHLFQSTRPVRARRILLTNSMFKVTFQSTRPVRARPLCGITGRSFVVFQSTRPVRARLTLETLSLFSSTFQSTRPMRGATEPVKVRVVFPYDFNPRAPCGARRRDKPAQNAARWISIHAPHAGRDHRRDADLLHRGHISIHAPHAGRDLLTQF